MLTDGTLVTGDAVHVAARVARAAEPGGVCLTRQVFLEFGPELRLHCRPIGTRELKGVTQPFELLELDWRDPSAFPRRVLIEETEQQIALPQQDIVSFGRLHEPEGARANDIVLFHPDPVARARSAAGTSSCAVRPTASGCARCRTASPPSTASRSARASTCRCAAARGSASLTP